MKSGSLNDLLICSQCLNSLDNCCEYTMRTRTFTVHVSTSYFAIPRTLSYQAHYFRNASHCFFGTGVRIDTSLFLFTYLKLVLSVIQKINDVLIIDLNILALYIKLDIFAVFIKLWKIICIWSQTLPCRFFASR